MNWLTRQEQFVLATVLALLLCGWAVKTYRTSQLKAQGNPVPVAATNAVTNTNQ